jgi:transposase
MKARPNALKIRRSEKSVEVDLETINPLNQVLKKLEWHIEKTARQHNYHTLYLLRSIPGVEQVLTLVIFYEIHDIKRFPKLQAFSSYARLIRPVKKSHGKWAGHSNKKSGNHPLKRAVKEAAILMLRDSAEAKYYVSQLVGSRPGDLNEIKRVALNLFIYYLQPDC